MKDIRWKDILASLEGEEEFDAGKVAKAQKMPYANAAQMLKRLQNWGYIRVVGFDPAVRRNPKGRSMGGRRRKVYELTPHGKKSIEYHRKKR